MEQIILFIFLILFPFGQVVRIGIVQPIDLVVGVAALWTILKGYPKPKAFNYINAFLLVAFFSWLVSASIFWRFEVFYGLLYLIRLAAYVYFLPFVWNFVKKGDQNKKLLLNSLLFVTLISAAFGWIQYFAYPSIRFLFSAGWDEHLYRLLGTFLDPTFLSLIFVFAIVISIFRYFQKKKVWYLLAAGFLTVSLAFTYARAGYLAFFVAIIALSAYYKKLKYAAMIVVGFFMVMLALPTSRNTTLRFTREFSALARIENYQETINIFKKSPLWGVGYNNLCLAKSQVTGKLNLDSHACSGSDSSLLFVLATTGLAGFLAFIYAGVKIFIDIRKSKYFIVFASCFAALFVHSLFANSLVYPWVMGYIAILLGTSLGREV